ncbi:hypothetical protein J3F83DRAFT_742985 [Trichoderma novae-zelandiae]
MCAGKAWRWWLWFQVPVPCLGLVGCRPASCTIGPLLTRHSEQKQPSTDECASGYRRRWCGRGGEMERTGHKRGGFPASTMDRQRDGSAVTRAVAAGMRCSHRCRGDVCTGTGPGDCAKALQRLATGGGAQSLAGFRLAGKRFWFQ